MSLTPKPWFYGTRRDGSKWLSLGDPSRGQHRQGDLVATKEDADLICAAPDLLEACREFISVLGPEGYHPTAGKTATDRMRAAIAKAEGRS